jgi:uncharacterized protein
VSFSGYTDPIVSEVIPQDPPVVAPAQTRAPTLDLLRGIAVLGILLINIYSFALPEVTRFNPAFLPHNTPFEQWCWYLINFFADTKFIALLSLAFGASLWMFAADKQALETHRMNRLQWRRSICLLCLGLLHGYLLWDGDVLVTYALFSVVVWRWRDWSDRQLIAMAVLLIAFQSLLYGSLFFVPEKAWQEMSHLYDGSTIDEDAAHYLQNWWQQTPRRFIDAFDMQLATLFGGWLPGALMMCGLVLARRGYFSTDPPAQVNRLLIVTLLLGTLLMAFALWTARANGFSSQYALTVGLQLQSLASMLLAIAYALLILRWSSSLLLLGLRSVLIKVGRMALSIYIMQTLIFTSVFYGYGMGWYGQLALSQLLLIVMLAWLFLCAFAVVWLRYFYMGPLEWLWRRLVYQKPLMLRRLET